MKLLHVISSVNPAGGGPIESIVGSTAAIEKLGHSVEVASLDDPNASWVKESSLSVHALGPSSSGYAYSSSFLPWLRANRSSYDAIIVNGLWQYHSLATWQALNKTDTPYFVFTHGMLDPWFKRTYPLKHLKKSFYWPWAEYRVLRDAKGVCFTCEEERLLARQSFRLYKCKEIVVAFGCASPTGDIHSQREAFLNQFSALRSKKLVLFLGRIHPKKGCDLLIEAFARIAEKDNALQLVMAGPDQTGWQTQLQNQAQELHIAERITWTGMLRGDLKWGAFYAADAFILPSHQENFGIAVAEALACGVPVLISNKVNIWREIQTDGVGIVGDDTVEGTKKTLQQWLALPEEQKHTFRRNAKKCFESRFEIHRAAQSLINVLQGRSDQDL